MKDNFNVEQITNECIQWIRDWFDKNGKGCKAVLGISGGKDSTICAALCAKALGDENVIGVSMPDEGQSINEADEICKYFGIKYKKVNIGKINHELQIALGYGIHPDYCLSNQSLQNIPPRIRMTVLYAIAQTENGRVVCCDNASENYIGYSTLFGDDVGSFAPLLNLTVTEVRAIGHYLGIPDKWVEKVPDDGLPHSCSDEEKIGFSYNILDKYIRGEENPDNNTLEKIIKMHYASEFKRKIIHVDAYMPEFAKLPL